MAVTMPATTAIKTFLDLQHDVEAHGGVNTYRMELLRDIAGYAKMGVHVRGLVRNELLKNGMASKADGDKDLGEYQWDRVRVWLLVGPIARIISAVATIGEEADGILREAAGGSGEAEEILQKIKALICD